MINESLNTIRFPYNIIASNIINGKVIIDPFKYFIFDRFNLEITNWIDPDGIELKFMFTIEFNNSAVKAWSESCDYCEIPLLDFDVYEDSELAGSFAWFTYDPDYYMQGDLIDKNNNRLIQKEDNDIRSRMAFMCLKIIIFCLGYIMNYPRKHKQERIAFHRYSREHRLSISNNKIYLFDDIVKYVSDNYIPEGGHHNIQCPCWEVRGHYRRYKSGKVVFIQSYRKGKQRDTAQPKKHEYYI